MSADLKAALRDAHKLFENAQLIKGTLCVPVAEVLGWAVRHAGAISAALSEAPAPNPATKANRNE